LGFFSFNAGLLIQALPLTVDFCCDDFSLQHDLIANFRELLYNTLYLFAIGIKAMIWLRFAERYQ